MRAVAPRRPRRSRRQGIGRRLHRPSAAPAQTKWVAARRPLERQGASSRVISSAAADSTEQHSGGRLQRAVRRSRGARGPSPERRRRRAVTEFNVRRHTMAHNDTNMVMSCQVVLGGVTRVAESLPQRDRRRGRRSTRRVGRPALVGPRTASRAGAEPVHWRTRTDGGYTHPKRRVAASTPLTRRHAPGEVQASKGTSHATPPCRPAGRGARSIVSRRSRLIAFVIIAPAPEGRSAEAARPRGQRQRSIQHRRERRPAAVFR